MSNACNHQMKEFKGRGFRNQLGMLLRCMVIHHGCEWMAEFKLTDKTSSTHKGNSMDKKWENQGGYMNKCGLSKVHVVKAMVFPVDMNGCVSWTIKRAYHQRIDAFEIWCWRRLLSPLDCKEIKPVNPIGNQPWIFIGRTDLEAEAPILWPPDARSWLIRNEPSAGKDGRRKDKGVTEDEMAI